MSEVDLNLFKQCSRFDDYAVTDEVLQFRLDAAEEAVITWTARTRGELIAMGGGTLPLPLQQAIIALADHWQDNVGVMGQGAAQEMPYSLQALIKPYRKLVEGGA